MAIALDNSALQRNLNVSSQSFSYTCTGANRILFAGVVNGNSLTVTSIKYNTVAMTSVAGSFSQGATVFEMFYLIGPASGANTVDVVLSGTAQAVNTLLASYTGASQGALDATGTAGPTTTTSFTESITTVADNCWLSWVAQVGAVQTAGTNSVIRQQDGVDYGLTICDPNGAQTPAGSKSMNNTVASSTAWKGIMVSFAPAVASAGATTLPLLGVG